MAQIKPIGLVESMSGKVCGRSDVYFFRKNGKVFSGKICHPYKGEPTAAQRLQRAKFTTAHTNALAATADSERRAAYMAAFENQHKYRDFNGYVFAQEYAKLGE